MSIIQEALKKAEDRIDDRGASAPAKAVKHEEAVSSSKATVILGKVDRPINSKPIFSDKEGRKAFLSIVLLSVFIVFIITVSLLSGRPPYKSTALPSASDMPLRAEAYSVMPPSVQLIQNRIKMEHPDFVLNGIMYQEDLPRAIINNVMVEEGDMVQGATVRKIGEGSVTLVSKDAEITLKLK